MALLGDFKKTFSILRFNYNMTTCKALHLRMLGFVFAWTRC